MSKAFTRESDDTSGDEIASLRPPVPRYITKEGAERLRQQANVLLEEKRALLTGSDVQSVDTTSKVRRIEAGLRRIQQVLDSVIISEPRAHPGKVGFGACVRIRDQQGEEEIYRIVGPDEAEPGQGRISLNSPVAQALMNSRVGDTVRFNSPAGEQQLTILQVHY